ncbi:MFS transporter [Bacillus sp. ISL-18]|uniref:MFS transporter n=1 Tax=Bacillus sp. ISL-18 TaxID=2819118 RepID=UPI001BEA9F64|nr:MFS transporter [Bacillus sp. ISL-18]MBT2657909.1 MFS transporter [Bacillus sp. ISL-18]
MSIAAINASEEKRDGERKNLLLYAAGKTISVFGTAIYQFAMGLYVLKLTGSALSFAATLILGILPMVIINPFAGVIADKFDKKRLVVSMDLLNGMLLVFVYVFSHIFGLTLVIIYAATLLMTVFSTFFGVGMESAKPNIVTEKRLMNLNSIGKVIDSVSSIMGPMLGGMVFAFVDIRAFILINGISFLLSGVSILLIRFTSCQESKSAGQLKGKIVFTEEIKDGFHYLIGRRKILNLFILLISLNFFLGFAVMVPIPYIMNTIFRIGAKEFGIIEGAFPVGMILGALLVKKIIKRIAYSSLLRYLSVALSLLMVISGIPLMVEGLNDFWIVSFYSLIMFLFGGVVALIDIPFSYIMQIEILDEYRGRVLSIGISIGKVLLPVAMVSSGFLLSHIPSYLVPTLGGGLFFLCSVKNTAKRRIRLEEVKEIE